MARPISSRLRISGTLVACGPLHIGGADGNADVDLALAVNGSGRLYVPGTSLAGSLRAWLRDRTDPVTVKNTWGYQEEGKKDGDSGIASFVFVEDGLVKLPDGTTVETRDGVGIDRVLGAAAERVKYNRAVLPAGTEIELDLTVELAKKDDSARDLILAALHALQTGQIRLGAAKTRGLGRVTLKNLSVGEQELLSFRGMLDALRGKVQPLDVNNLSSTPLSGAPNLNVKIDWRPRGPLMVKAEHDGVAVDMLPLVSARCSDLTFVLPGSSIKGALRSQAERILRTVCGIAAPEVKDQREDFMRQIELSEPGKAKDEQQTPAMLLIGGLFGRRAKVQANIENIPDQGPPLPGLGALTVEDCYAAPRFTPSQWETIESAPDAGAEGQIIDGPNSPLRQALEDAGLGKMQQAFHVAIDRWTGGAADGFLYTVLEPHAVAWEPIRLTLALSRLPSHDQKPALMSLLLTLRDLVDRRIPLGFAANRGMGSIDVTGVELTVENLGADLNDLKSVTVVDGKLAGWSESLKDTLENSWRQWRSPYERQDGTNDSLRTGK